MSNERERIPFPMAKRKLKLKKINKKTNPKNYTIYYQDNRETTVVNIMNQENPDQVWENTSSDYTTTGRMKGLKTPFFGEKKSNFNNN